jgi:hypothetical protein
MRFFPLTEQPLSVCSLSPQGAVTDDKVFGYWCDIKHGVASRLATEADCLYERGPLVIPVSVVRGVGSAKGARVGGVREVSSLPITTIIG